MKWTTALPLALGLAVLFGFMGWALISTGSMQLAGASSTTSMVMIIAGVVGVGALAGALMWLAFYSARKGYDEPPKFDTDPTGEDRK